MLRSKESEKMARVIDADNFKRFLQSLCDAGAPYEDVIVLLDKEPTVCDIKNIEAELESLDNMIFSRSLNKNGVFYVPLFEVRQKISKALEVVRKGGVNE